MEFRSELICSLFRAVYYKSPKYHKFSLTIILHHLKLLVFLSFVSCTTKQTMGQSIQDADPVITEQVMETWATKLKGYLINDLAKTTGAKELRKIYERMNPQISNVDGIKMVDSFASEMQTMLAKKIDAIQNIVYATENETLKYNDSINLEEFDYYNANFLNKFVNGTPAEGFKQLNLERVEGFSDLVNLTISSIQVPINIYKYDPDVLFGIKMTEPLNKIFYKNYQNDKTLTWQYFASPTGFFRNYPGVQWSWLGSPYDMYDSRERSWYLQASHSPKDVVILLDRSGSMTGSRLAVAKSSIKSIVDTLLDDDFFNILQFADEVTYLEECFNGSLVQANSDKKAHLKAKLDSVQSEGIANFRAVLEEAFQLLAKFNNSGRGSSCNQAIMLLTDGAVDTYQSIFAKYNWPDKKVRVFTYIIGRDVKNSFPAKWMACNNKGYYAQIATLADVKINVMQYIHVLSRPMVIEQDYQYKWTNVYLDQGGGDGGKLMTTVSMPAFDKRAKKAKEGNLLGVAGVDVPVSEMNKFTPAYMLGLNGYTFAITNNGYILFHPALVTQYWDKEKKQYVDKPNYNSVDFAEVEMFEEAIEDKSQVKYNRNEDMMRRLIVGGKVTGNYSLSKVIYPLSNWKRAAVRRMDYFFTPLENTPFRLGIAIDKVFGLTNFTLPMFDGRRYGYGWKGDALSEPDIRLDDWVYCHVKDKYLNQTSQLEAVSEAYKSNIMETTRYKCNPLAVRMVAEDANATFQFAYEHWSPNRLKMKNNGIIGSFVRTRSGLMKFYNQLRPDNISALTAEDLSVIADYFQIAASIYEYTQDEGTYVFWIPERQIIGMEDVMVVARLVFVHQPPESSYFGSSFRTNDDRRKKALAAVVGVYVDLRSVRQQFTSIVGAAERLGKQERFTYIAACNDSLVDCYMLDQSGFIIASKVAEHSGKFLGSIDGNAMKALINNNIYYNITMLDNQAMCYRQKESKLAGSASRPVIRSTLLPNLLGVISSAYSYAFLIFQHITFILYNFSISNLLALLNLTDDVLASDYALEKAPEYTYESCDHNVSVYQRNFGYQYKYQAIKIRCNETSNEANSCTRRLSFYVIEETNLALISLYTLNGECRCDLEPFTLGRVERQYLSKTEHCERLLYQKYRERPPECHNFHKNEDSKHCGFASSVSASTLLLTISILCGLLMVT